jgi:peptide/nickel transport system substrate-binding protein
MAATNPVWGERGTRPAALQTGRLDVSMPLEMTKTMADTLKQAVPSLVVTVVGQNGSDNVVVNHKRAPFDTLAVRRAVSLAMDRHAYVKGVRHNGALVGAALMPPPQGTWGLAGKDLRALPGFGDPVRDKAEARKLLAEAGFGPGKPLRVELVYFPALARRDYQIGANLTASGIDDPDGYLFENYKCGASRNYTDYCNETMDRLIDYARMQEVWLDR